MFLSIWICWIRGFPIAKSFATCGRLGVIFTREVDVPVATTFYQGDL